MNLGSLYIPINCEPTYTSWYLISIFFVPSNISHDHVHVHRFPFNKNDVCISISLQNKNKNNCASGNCHGLAMVFGCLLVLKKNLGICHALSSAWRSPAAETPRSCRSLSLPRLEMSKTGSPGRQVTRWSGQPMGMLQYVTLMIYVYLWIFMVCNMCIYDMLCIFMFIWDVNDLLMVRNSQPHKLDSRSRGNSTGQTSSTSKDVTNLQRAITVGQGYTKHSSWVKVIGMGKKRAGLGADWTICWLGLVESFGLWNLKNLRIESCWCWRIDDTGSAFPEPSGWTTPNKTKLSGDHPIVWDGTQNII